MRRSPRRLIPKHPPEVLICYGSTALWLLQAGAKAAFGQWFWAGLYVVTGLVFTGVFWWHWRKTARQPRSALHPDGLRKGLSPQCFCLGCGVLVAVKPACPTCGGQPPVAWGKRETCKECRREVKSREEFRARGLRWLCADSVARLQSMEVHPTWVVGILCSEDFHRLRRLPGTKLFRVEDVSLVYLPPADGEEVALCAVDLEGLPETGTVRRDHALAGMQALWLGAGNSRLDAHRALDRMEFLTGLAPDEVRRLEILTEDPEPEPELRKAFAHRLGPLTAGVSLQALRACRPEATQHAVADDPPRVTFAAPELEQAASIRR